MRNLGVTVAAMLMFAGGLCAARADDRLSPQIPLREEIVLSAEEHATVLSKMRELLVLSQLILDGALTGNRKQVATAAREGGLRGGAHMPPSVQAKLPPAFRQLAQGTHRTFDEIAQEAEHSGERDVILRKLSTNLQNCVTCHSGYAIRSATASRSP